MTAVRYHSGGFPPDNRLQWQALIPFIGPATAAVARYDGMLAGIPNQDILLAPLMTREAVMSSRIEGTEATIGDVLGFEAGRKPESRARLDDIQEVLNYRRALTRAEKLLDELPLSLRIVREAHAVLLDGVRGRSKAPGEFRRTANWIGPPGCSVEQARFVPASADALPDALAAWERYIHADAPDRLVQLAVLHAEFEALHPFLDGNGRLGRMLVPLFLWKRGFIRTPSFYISAHFEAHRQAYYDGLLAVSRDDDWTGWCRFFLDAVRAQAEDNLARVQRILALYDEMKRRVSEATGSRYAAHALDWFFRVPIFNAKDFQTKSGIPPRTARRLLGRLCEGGFLEVPFKASGRQAAVYVYPAVLDVAEGRDPSRGT